MNHTTKSAQFTPGTCQCRWSGAVNFVMCPLHTAAPAMYEALQIMVRAANVDEIDPLVMFASIERAKAALELAEGKRDRVEQPLMRTQAEGR